MAIIAEDAPSEDEGCWFSPVPVVSGMRLNCAPADKFRGGLRGEFQNRAPPEVI